MEPVRAPSLDVGFAWLNTDRPLRFGQELGGHVVLLDFWTYCCINCMHILPDLAYLEEKYANDPFIIVGVHSAKFDNEANRGTIRSAILRYEIKHPVVIDEGMRLWRAYGVRSWPTVVVIDPLGCVVGALTGEGNRKALDETVARLLAEHRQRGTLAAGPLRPRLEALVPPASGLAFPGKVHADADGKRIFIADSNHNRIVVTTWPEPDGHCSVIKVVGGGAIGRADGDAQSASFNHPQGMTVIGNTLYVADTENHLIRAIDLSTWRVTTAVGTGAMTYDFAGGGMGTQQGINSPWDVTAEGSTVYVAMAGTHQIWRMEMPIGFARALAGTGRENIVDGPTERAACAQPSGICAVGGNLYFADSEVSAIRGIDMATERVFTVIGQGLFVFGDVDGAHPEARFQHPLGVTAYGNELLVADTYNHKIKLVEPSGRSARTLSGDGVPGAAAPDGAVRFNEPGGLHAVGDTLFVADTNNHRIVMMDVKTGRWAELTVDGLTSTATTMDADVGNVIQAGEIAVALDRPIELSLNVALPPGAHLNADAPWSVRVTAGDRTVLQKTGVGGALPIGVTIPAGPTRASDRVSECWRVTLAAAYCTDGDAGLCAPVHVIWQAGIRRDAAGRDRIALDTLRGEGH